MAPDVGKKVTLAELALGALKKEKSMVKSLDYVVVVAMKWDGSLQVQSPAEQEQTIDAQEASERKYQKQQRCELSTHNVHH